MRLSNGTKIKLEIFWQNLLHIATAYPETLIATGVAAFMLGWLLG